jgi:hypothetical protein
MTALLNANEKDNIDRANDLIISFQIQKISFQGVEGFFIPLSGYKNLNYILNDYIYMQDLLIYKDERIAKLERLEVKNFRLKTALGVSISFDVGSLFLCAGLGILCYNLALQK